jgi:hypothetical protein
MNTWDSQLIRMAFQCRSPLEQQRINLVIEVMFNKGIIQLSKSAWVLEPHLVRTNNGSYHLYINFRPLNQVTIHDRYPDTLAHLI